MSDTEAKSGKAAGSGWTDKERLTYLFALIDNTGVKLDYNTTPRPNGRSVIACQRMVDRLKGTLKDELEALKAGDPIGNVTPKKARANGNGDGDGEKKTPTKRKTKGEANVDGEGSPKKRGRKKKADAEVEVREEVKQEVDASDEI
ncbi:hypothetical protein BU26DRAFT_84453 [Trematosphaeria pertusa]|uniref:Uncharacterized protein n=1 Tax=Trematosphaeria pertusa TaxID=390896 RepID=A0A6A6I559_9PLEO|nr:uncharacterized protein BU26DRAFT_84453 [Trematosphaeria pertusa]KAF2244693.1 hypothetical protein BU26DRAFT_84453 [Trematosphaeria pertusa]